MPGGLGLKPQPHLAYQDARYLLTQAPGEPLQQFDHLADVTWAFFRDVLNQGQEGTCVGHGCQYLLEFGPIIQCGHRPKGYPNKLAHSIYDRAWPLDGNPPGPVRRDTGLTLDAGCKVMRADSYIGEWRHTFLADEVIRYLGGVDKQGRRIGGPMLVGIPWFRSMNTTDANGLIRVDPSSGLLGYHCVCLQRWNNRKGVAIFPNSWGRDGYGKRGYGAITGEDLVKAFRHYGHAVATFEQRKPK